MYMIEWICVANMVEPTNRFSDVKNEVVFRSDQPVKSWPLFFKFHDQELK